MLDSEFLGTTNNSVKIAQVSARTFDRAFTLAKPTIAVVEGYAVAGGFELAISCDFRIVADDARIGDFHIRRALFGGAGPIYRLPRYIGLRKTKELLSPASCSRANKPTNGDSPTSRPQATNSTRQSPTSSPR